MTSVSDAKVFSELDKKLAEIQSQKGLPDCNTYNKELKPALVKAVAIIKALPDWLKPGWANTLVVALEALMLVLDKVCPVA